MYCRKEVGPPRGPDTQAASGGEPLTELARRIDQLSSVRRGGAAVRRLCEEARTRPLSELQELQELFCARFIENALAGGDLPDVEAGLRALSVLNERVGAAPDQALVSWTAAKTNPSTEVFDFALGRWVTLGRPGPMTHWVRGLRDRGRVLKIFEQWPWRVVCEEQLAALLKNFWPLSPDDALEVFTAHTFPFLGAYPRGELLSSLPRVCAALRPCPAG